MPLVEKAALGMAAGCVILVIWICVSITGTPSPAPTHSAPFVGAPTPRISASPAPVVQTPASWQEVMTISGQSTKKTDLFTVTANRWRVSWATKPGGYGATNFAVWVYRANGDTVGLIANIIGAGQDDGYEYGAGSYYLDITSSQPYGIVVEELR